LVPADSVIRYGILAPRNPVPDSAEAFEFTRIVEKPAVESAPSRFAVAARWALDSGIFAYLRRTPPDPKGELGLSQAVDLALQDGNPGRAIPLAPEESRVDIGSWQGYLQAAATAIATDLQVA
jgi:UTP--glucose-1-phosphate uridylyltransferase